MTGDTDTQSKASEYEMTNEDSYLTALGGDPDQVVLVEAGDAIASLRKARSGDGVYLMKIRTNPRSQQQGFGSALLGRLCDEADREDVTLFLEVEETAEGPDAQTLADWYWRFGFRGDKTEMVRLPAGEGDR